MANINIGGRLHSTATGNTVVGANEILDDSINKKQSEINAETYRLVENINNSLGNLSPEQTEALSVAEKANNNEVKLGYFECETESNIAAKVITNASGYILSKGGSIKIKMINDNIASNVTLNINSTGAKTLYYNNELVSPTNTWKNNEIVEVYYDGNNYYANNIECVEKFATGEKIKELGIDDEPTARSKNLVKSGGVFLKINKETFIQQQVSSSNKIKGKYITINGSIGTLGAYNIYYFKCQKGDKFKVTYTGEAVPQAGSCWYGVYSTEDISLIDSNTCIRVGSSFGSIIPGTEYDIDIIDENAKIVCIVDLNVMPISLVKERIVKPVLEYIDENSTFTSGEKVKELRIETYPRKNSSNLVTSGGVKELEEIDMKGILSVFEKGLLKGSKISPSNTIPGYYIDGVTGALILISSNNYNVNQYKVNEGDILLIDSTVAEQSHLAAYAIYTSDDFTSNNLVKLVFNNQKGYWCCIVPKGGTYLGTNYYNKKGNVYNIGNINTIISSIETNVGTLQKNVDNINSDLILNYNFYDFSDLTQTQQQYGYIDSSGVFQSTKTGSNFICREYSVSEGEVIKIINQNHQGIRLSYAFYQGSFCQTLIMKGNLAVESPDEKIVVTPPNANYLVVSEFVKEAKAQLGVKVSHDDFYVQVETYIEQHSNIDIQSTNWLERYAYHYDGVENLYVAYNNGNGVETCYWFKKCMANQLYTFYLVGYRPVTRKYPSIENISNWSGITTINATGSDNIGPINYTSTAGEGGGSWVGGNHHYPSESASPNYLTAVNDYYHIFIDNKQISDEDSGFAKYINILVKNTIFDPGFAPEQGATSLSTPLCDEYVNYVICKNTIEVSVKHKYASTAQGTIGIYYGMQSMCVDENYYMTPLGLRTSWQATQSSDSFTKQDYPNFNRFIEKRSNPAYYQSTYLYPNFSLGKHTKISNNTAIFNRSYGKDYHICIKSLNVTSSTVYQWAGSYTFFTNPLLDNSDGFAYIGSVGGKSCLFVNTLHACELTIPIPSDLALRKFNVIENKTSSGQQCFTSDDDTTDFYIGGEGLYLKCSEIGSLIIQFD